LSHFALQREGVTDIAFITLRPQILVSRNPDQLSREAHSIAGTKYGAFDDGLYIEFAADLGQRFVQVFVSHHRGAGDDAQRADVGKLGDQLIGHAIREVILRRIAGKVFQWQDR